MTTENFGKVYQNAYLKWLIFSAILYILLPNSLSSGNYLCDKEIININSCLDRSWSLSINWALQKNLIFGKDYVFTYGPLGFLSTRADLGISPLYFLLFDLFVIGNLAFILLYVFRRFYSLSTIGLCFLTVAALSESGMYYEQIVFLLLLISIFWLHYSLKYSAPAGLIVPVVITVLLFYIKVNMCFVAISVFYLYLFYFIFFDRKNIVSKILLGLATPFLIFLLSFPLKTYLPGYILGSLSLIDGYNDAMNSRLPEYADYSNFAVIILIIFFISLFARKSVFKERLILFLTSGIFSFVLFKQSFVRADMHVAIFFTVFPGFCALILIFYRKISSYQVVLLAGICVFCLAIGLRLGVYTNPKDRMNYFAEVFSGAEMRQARYENNFARFTLPAEVKNLIGEKTVDIVPWNIDFLYFNRLNYQPRPVIQSYSVYTPYLIKLNGQRYEDDLSAPDFVLFTNKTLDGRYAFFDDAEVKMSLIKNYSCLGLYNSQDSDFLLFQRKPQNAVINFSAPVEETIKFGEDYLLQDSGKSYFVKMNIKYSLAGKAVRFLFKPFQLSIYFTLADGTTRWHRAIIPILEHGGLINPYIEGEKDLLNFAKEGFSPDDSKKIKSFRIEIDSSKPGIKKLGLKTYEQDIKLSVSEISINRND